MRSTLRFFVGTFAVLGLSLANFAGAASASDLSLDSRRAALSALLAEQWEYNLSVNPEFASILGDKRFNDKLSVNSPRGH